MIRNKLELQGVHPDLIKVVQMLDLMGADVYVLDGVRTVEEQRKLMGSKTTTTMNSRHLTGHAVDLGVILDGKITWEYHRYEDLAMKVKEAAKEVGVSIEWGGDWKTLKDGDHFQLPWAQYPLHKEK